MEPIVPFGTNDAATVKATAATQRANLARDVQSLEAQQAAAKAELEKARRDLEAQFAARQAELVAQMQPLQKQLAQLTEVLSTVNLYLGRDEQLRLLRDGTPAPADTPITIRQRVLSMAEESLVLMERSTTGMTADDVPEFIEWVLSDDAHLSRILPEPKGVVVLIPTRVPTRSGNAWEDAAKDARNNASYWLLRNGDRVYLLTVDPSLNVSDRVLPRRREFTDVFDQKVFGVSVGRPVEPGSDAWLQMQERADARRRHFMRVMLVLQGIIDRTPVWAPLPPGGVNLLDVQAQDTGKVVLVQDDDPDQTLTDGRESFRAFQSRLNKLLRPGLRVVGNWQAHDFKDLAYDGQHPRVSPSTIPDRPASDVPHLIEDRRDGYLVIRYERTEQIWKRGLPVPDKPGYVYTGERLTAPSRRASMLIHPDDTWILPYDLVTVDDLEYYLTSRENRTAHFLSMVPTVQAALAAKKAEAAQEAPFRDLLARMLHAEGAPEDELDRLVDDLVHWWKLARTWTKPLNGDPAHEKNAADEIITEYRSRAKDDADTSAYVTAGRAVPGVIAVARNRRGHWLAYKPSTPAHDKSVFLDVLRLRKDKNAGTVTAVPDREFVPVPPRTVATLTVAWSAPEWDEWNFAANPNHYLTAAERASVVDELLESATGTPICVTEYFDPAKPGRRVLTRYEWTTGTPKTTPIRPVSGPLSWHHDRGPDELVHAHAVAVTKTKAGNVTTAPAKAYTDEFDHFSGGSRWGNTPWWPEEARDPFEARPRLTWSDEGMLDALKEWLDRCAGAARAARAEASKVSDLAYRYVNAVQSVILDALTREARERFRDDFGDATDLWDAHLKSLGLRSPIHDRTLWGLFAARITDGLPVAGCSLGELADWMWEEKHNQAPGEWHPGYTRVNLSDHDNLVVPDLPEEN